MKKYTFKIEKTIKDDCNLLKIEYSKFFCHKIMYFIKYYSIYFSVTKNYEL